MKEMMKWDMKYQFEKNSNGNPVNVQEFSFHEMEEVLVVKKNQKIKFLIKKTEEYVR